jgi:hypothetical protein
MMSKSTPPYLGYSNVRAIVIAILISFFVFDTTAISDQCESEILALSSNTALTDAAPFVECTLYVDISDECTADFAQESDTYRDLCLDAGGQFFTSDVVLDCFTIVSGVTYDADYNFLNFPVCVGASCSEAEITAEFERISIPAFERKLALKGIYCQGDSTNEMITNEAGQLKSNNDNTTTRSDAGSSIFNLKNIGFLYSIASMVVVSLTLTSIL